MRAGRKSVDTHLGKSKRRRLSGHCIIPIDRQPSNRPENACPHHTAAIMTLHCSYLPQVANTLPQLGLQDASGVRGCAAIPQGAMGIRTKAAIPHRILLCKAPFTHCDPRQVMPQATMERPIYGCSNKWGRSAELIASLRSTLLTSFPYSTLVSFVLLLFWSNLKRLF